MGFLDWIFSKSLRHGESQPCLGHEESLGQAPGGMTDSFVQNRLREQMNARETPVRESRMRSSAMRVACDAVRVSVESAKAEQTEADRRRIRLSVVHPRSGAHFSLAEMRVNDVQNMMSRDLTFGLMLMHYVTTNCGGRASDCYQRAGVSRQLYSRIISDLSKGVSKRIALQLCIGLRLSRDQAVDLLSCAGYSLSRSSYEDMAFAWCFEHGVYSIFDVNELLTGGGCAPISIN